jgi:hypothetical protein
LPWQAITRAIGIVMALPALFLRVVHEDSGLASGHACGWISDGYCHGQVSV